MKKQIYKITYPNGKIYIGKDLTGTLTYFGSVDSSYVEKDFSKEEQYNFSITKEILWETECADNIDINKKEVEFIRKYRSNNPEIGYNKWPKLREGHEENYGKSIRIFGPFTWPGFPQKGICPLESVSRSASGLYLWTFPYREGFIVYAAGITRRSFLKRFKEHTKNYLSGVYTIFDLDEMRQGKKIKIWPGFWMKKDRKHLEKEFFAREAEIKKSIQCQLSEYRIFLSEVPATPRLLERLEAAIMNHLYSLEAPFSTIPDKGMMLASRWENEQPIFVNIECETEILGIPDVLTI